MPEPRDVALEALKKMRAERGDNARFSSDEIWSYSKSEVPSPRRPGAIGWLHRNGYIERTGKMMHATTPARAGSMTPEYQFVPPGPSLSVDIKILCGAFEDDCEDVIKVNPNGVLRLTSALLSKRFVIFTGLSGSGKTKLAQAFARWITPAWTFSDPFYPGAIFKAKKNAYTVISRDTLGIEFQNDEGTKALLPRAIIEQWADYIEKHNIPDSIPALELKDMVKAESGAYSPHLHDFETHYKLAAFALRSARHVRTQEKSYEVVPVGADWTGNENVLGYPNGLEPKSYVAKPALNLILRAIERPTIPHFLILDEMNLSHVERYFADILSVIESEEEIPLYQDEERSTNNKPIPLNLALPKNLFVIGTVNVDETTYMFSPKVLDRANVIEFRVDADELKSFLDNSANPDLANLDSKGASFGKAFVDAAKSPVDVPAHVKPAYGAEMLLFFGVLQEHGAEFGYRVAHEAARFIHFYNLLGNYPDSDTSWFAGAFDCVVVQKILPKLHGSRAKLGPLLKKLWFLCVNNDVGRGTEPLQAADDVARSTDKKAEPSTKVPAGAPYSLSAEKIGRMWRLLNENGFTSFSEA